MAVRRAFARRFIAGETRAKMRSRPSAQIEAQGMHQTLDHLGESVATLDGGRERTREYLEPDRGRAHGPASNRTCR